nr:D-alanine--D-alanine ligase [uncultured bacterium]
MTTQLTKQTRIGVLYGGMSSERDVSLISGKNCYEALKRLGYENTVLIDVAPNVAQRLKEENIEVAYNALHGKFGEDGCIQGLLQIMGIPCTGCGVEASAITMNKAVTKSILKDAGLPVLPSLLYRKIVKPVTVPASNNTEWEVAGSVQKPERFPVMVKPISEGSSIGMSKVDREEDLNAALEEAFKYADEVMVEVFVKGKSLTVGVVDIEKKPKVLPILELRPVKSEWYDLEAKYTKGLTEFILPAELSENTTRQVQDATLKAHIAAGCSGMSRTDFVVDSDNNFYILEINTVPGMTPLSDLPAQAQAVGISYDELVEYILKSAF